MWNFSHYHICNVIQGNNTHKITFKESQDEFGAVNISQPVLEDEIMLEEKGVIEEEGMIVDEGYHSMDCTT